MQILFQIVHITNGPFRTQNIPFPANENNRTLNISLFLRLDFLSARKMYFVDFDSFRFTSIMTYRLQYARVLFCFLHRLTQRQSIDKWKFEPSFKRHVQFIHASIRLAFIFGQIIFVAFEIYAFNLIHRLIAYAIDSRSMHQCEIIYFRNLCVVHRCESMIVMHDYSFANRIAMKPWIK